MLHYENETNNITHWNPFHIYAIIYNFTYKFINNFLHIHISCISGWGYNMNSTWTLLTHVNIAQTVSLYRVND
jgi:hypothetical protein